MEALFLEAEEVLFPAEEGLAVRLVPVVPVEEEAWEDEGVDRDELVPRLVVVGERRAGAGLRRRLDDVDAGLDPPELAPLVVDTLYLRQ